MEKRETPQDRYHKAHTVSLTIRLMKNTEQDILQKLDSVPNKAGYIKALIRADIEKETWKNRPGTTNDFHFVQNMLPTGNFLDNSFHHCLCGQ